jgi:low affinity Fe/Cu permease
MEAFFARLANVTAKIAGKPWTFLACVAVVLVWAVSGPIFRFSETWQLVINTGTTIVTFLMVFLIQNTQNRDGAAVQAKLDELIHAVRGADDRFIGIEHLTEQELDQILDEVEHRARSIHRSRKSPQAEPSRKEDAAAAIKAAAEPKARPAARKAKGSTSS